MINKKITLSILLTSFLLIGCSNNCDHSDQSFIPAEEKKIIKPIDLDTYVINGMHKKSAGESVEKILLNLTKLQQSEFLTAIDIILYTGEDRELLLSSPEVSKVRLRKKLNNLTYSQVLKKSVTIEAEVINKIRNERFSKLNFELSELNRQKSVTEAKIKEYGHEITLIKEEISDNKKLIKKINILSAEYIFIKDPVLKTKYPVIKISLKNNTTYSISQFYFKGAVYPSLSSDKPYGQDIYTYVPNKIVQPGEVISFEVIANWKHSQLSNIPKDKSSYIFATALYNFDDQDGESLLHRRISQEYVYKIKEFRKKIKNYRSILVNLIKDIKMIQIELEPSKTDINYATEEININFKN